MDRQNIVFAKRLVRIARMLLADSESFGHYSIEKGENNSLVVYFILNEDAIESDALASANACRDEIIRKLEGMEGSFDATSMQDNDHKSFCFSIVPNGDKKKSSTTASRTVVAIGDDDKGGGGGDDAGGSDGGAGDAGGKDSGGGLDLGGGGGGGLSLGDDKPSGDGDEPSDGGDKPEEPPKEDDKDAEAVKGVVKDVCKLHGWDAES